MNEANYQAENFKGFADKQLSQEAQKQIFGNHNQNQMHNVLRQSHSVSINGSSPMVKNTSQIYQTKIGHSSQQIKDLTNIKKLFNNKHYEQALESIDRYLSMYDPKNPQYIEGQENNMSSTSNNNSNLNQNQMNGVSSSSNHSSSQNLESDDKMDIEDKSKEKENEIIMLIQTKSDCYLHLNRNEEFFRCQDEIFARDNSQTKVFINKGSIYYQVKKYKESLDEFRKYVMLVNNDFEAYYWKGLVEEKLKLHQDALNSFEQSLLINPNQIKVVQKKTSLLATLQRYQEAIENQRKVIQYYEHNRNKQNTKQMYQHYFMMGKLYFHMNCVQDSFSFLEKAISERCDHSETYFYLGECFRLMNQLENAIECYEKAALYDSNNEMAMQRRDEVQKRLIQEQPSKAQYIQQQSSSQMIEEEAQIITLDDIKKDIEQLEQGKRSQIQKIKEGKGVDCDAFELESTRTLVQQYSLNLAAFKSFLRVQDQIDRASSYSNIMSQKFKPIQPSQFIQEKDDDSEFNSQKLLKNHQKQKSLFMSSQIFRAPNNVNQPNNQ